MEEFGLGELHCSFSDWFSFEEKLLKRVQSIKFIHQRYTSCKIDSGCTISESHSIMQDKLQDRV